MSVLWGAAVKFGRWGQHSSVRRVSQVFDALPEESRLPCFWAAVGGCATGAGSQQQGLLQLKCQLSQAGLLQLKTELSRWHPLISRVSCLS